MDETTETTETPQVGSLTPVEILGLKALCWDTLRQCAYPGGEVRICQPRPGFFHIELHDRLAVFGLKGKAPVIEPVMLVLAKLLEHGWKDGAIDQEAVAALAAVAREEGLEFYLRPVGSAKESAP